MKLQTIALNEIKGLDKRVRQQMSPEKLEELEGSIREEGLLVPIKVRKNGSGYVLVYGHRRVQAAKAAGLKEVDALVADVPEDKLLTQSLIENVIREDMAAIDIAKALQAILDETGASQDALAKQLGWAGKSTVSKYIDMLAPELGMEKSLRRDLDMRHVWEAKAGAGGDLKLAAQVLQRAGKDELSSRDTRKVAEEVKRLQEFGGQKEVARYLSLPKSQLLEDVQPFRPTKKPLKTRTDGAFKWYGQPAVLRANAGIQDVQELVSTIERIRQADTKTKGGKMRDIKGATDVLKSARRLMVDVVSEIDHELTMIRRLS